MSRTKQELKGITRLGTANTAYADSYDQSLLETFVNKHPRRDYWVTFTCPEFTSLCPLTGQPDFATLTIQYVPGKRMVESKSLKLYLFGFRNHGDFHEDCVNMVLNDLVAVMEPKYIEVRARFMPRGGIAINPYVNYGSAGTKYEALAEERFRWHDGERHRS